MTTFTTPIGDTSWTFTDNMRSFALLLFPLISIAKSKCFFPRMKPKFSVGLTTDMIDNEEQTQSIAHLEEWKLLAESHVSSFQRRETDLDEWIECYAKSMSFDYSDGIGSDLTVKEYSILMNTLRAFDTDFMIKHSTARYVDDCTIELEWVASVSGDVFRFVRGPMNWMGLITNDDGRMEWELTSTVQWRYNDEGLIEKHILVSPETTRQVISALLSVHGAISGPISQDMDMSDSLSFFGYNALVVMGSVGMVALTSLIGICVMLCMGSRTRN